MGKPSIKSKNSDHSLHSKPTKSKMSLPMGTQKLQKKKERSHSKTKNNIIKLFDVMRNESTTFSEDSFQSVINISDTPDNSTSNKRKCTNPDTEQESKRAKNDESLIIINDDDKDLKSEDKSTTTLTSKKGTTTLQCSTPINKKNSKVSLDDLVLSRFSNSINNNIPVVQNFNEEVNDLTKEINADSFLTIDLTTETLNCSSISKTLNNTVIDLDNTTENNDCTLVSVSNASFSMSGDSTVTVLHRPPKWSAKKEMRKVFKGISRMDPKEKGKMLECLVTQILNGCDVPASLKSTLNIEEPTPESVEDTYIKEIIVGRSHSRNSIGSNIYNPEHDVKNHTGLRMVIIDGSNVAMEHDKGEMFSVKGLKICIDYFLKRGHVVKAFVPRFRCKFGKSSDPRLLDRLERCGLVVYTPSREIQGRHITPYDDRYIVQCAAEFDGIIVSGDNYRDLLRENPRWKFVIENRVLPFTWVHDMIMFPRDPLGRTGPTLEQFLKHPNAPPDKKD